MAPGGPDRRPARSKTRMGLSRGGDALTCGRWPALPVLARLRVEPAPYLRPGFHGLPQRDPSQRPQVFTEPRSRLGGGNEVAGGYISVSLHLVHRLTSGQGCRLPVLFLVGEGDHRRVALAGKVRSDLCELRDPDSLGIDLG